MNAKPINIQTEFTPNPNSLKFNVNQTLLEEGSVYIETKEQAKGKSAIAEELFAIPNVENVLIGKNFLTVTRSPSVETWGALIEPITKVIESYLSKQKPMVATDSQSSTQKVPVTEIEKKIVQVLDTYIRPAIARDGGDIVFYGFKEGVVTLHLQGSCSSCPSSIATLKSGVERLLCELVPEVKEVVQLN